MGVDIADAGWQSVLPVLVVVLCLTRLVSFVRRRRNPAYQGWQPAEFIALRSVVLLITGRPVTPLTWRRIDLILLVMLALSVFANIYQEPGDSRHPSPLRQSLGIRATVATSGH